MSSLGTIVCSGLIVNNLSSNSTITFLTNTQFNSSLTVVRDITVSGGIICSQLTLNNLVLNDTLTSNTGTIIVAKNLQVNSSLIVLNNITVSGTATVNSNPIMLMNNSASAGSYSVHIDPCACILFSATGIGIAGTPSTPLITTSNGGDIGGLYKNPPAQYDFWRIYVNLVAGTYTFRLDAAHSSDRGIATIKINDVSVGTIDTYNVSGSLPIITDITGINISTSGPQKVEIQINTRNGASSAYYFIWRRAALIRTA
jgi:hypothetical protein